MIIGVPKEIKEQEHRVAFLPSGTSERYQCDEWQTYAPACGRGAWNEVGKAKAVACAVPSAPIGWGTADFTVQSFPMNRFSRFIASLRLSILVA